MKRTISSVLAGIILATSFSAMAANGVIEVYLNDEKIAFDTNPEIVNDRTFVPLRAIAEGLDSVVTWDGETQSITITKNGISNHLQIGNENVRTKDGETEVVDTLDAPPYIKDERTMVPLRFISEGFGMKVDWDGETQTINITYENKSDIEYYNGFEYIPDFGEYFGISKEEGYDDDVYFYLNVEEEQKTEYMNLLLSLGFVKVDEMVTNQIESYGFEKDNEQVVVATFDGVFGITPVHKQTGYEGELKFYEDYTAVPDYGALNAVKITNEKEIASNMTMYVYKYDADATELTNHLVNYLEVMEECGFEQFYSTVGSMMLNNPESNNSVIIEVASDGVVIIVEQVVLFE